MSKLREEWNHQYTVHPPYGCESISDQTEVQTETLPTCVRAFPSLRRFLCSHLHGLQLTPIQSSARKFGKSWWKKKMPVGVAGERKKGKRFGI